jgi:hypothetical protein
MFSLLPRRGWGLEEGTGTRAAPPSVPCSWFSPLGAHLGAPQLPRGGRAWGSRPGSRLPWQRPPQPRQGPGPRPRPRPAPAVPTLHTRDAPPPRGALGAPMATPAKLCQAAWEAARLRPARPPGSATRPASPSPPPTSLTWLGAPLPVPGSRLRNAREFGRVRLPPPLPRPPRDSLSSASLSLLPKSAKKSRS